MIMIPAVASSPAELTSTGTSEATDERATLRKMVEEHLADQGFVLSNGRILSPVLDDKARLRALHSEAVAERRRRARAALDRYEPGLVRNLAHGDEIDVRDIRPTLVPVDGHRSTEARLWRWCALHWSIPVSTGYGRRLRFLVVDRTHGDKVIGLIGLADPVFGLKSRDDWIGWNSDRRKVALANVMDAFALGAIPPYNALRGGKLVALLSVSIEVRKAFETRYGDRETLISQRRPDGRLALVTTTSALGRSSIYNRLYRPDRTLAFEPIGYTSGSGDFHLSGTIYDSLMTFAKRNGLAEHSQRHERWPGHQTGSPRSRRAVLDCALGALGFNPKALRLHGVRRQVFAAPLASNAVGYLRGDEADLDWYDLSTDEISQWWLDRWAWPRARRDDQWRDFNPLSWRLWPGGECGHTISILAHGQQGEGI